MALRITITRNIIPCQLFPESGQDLSKSLQSGKAGGRVSVDPFGASGERRLLRLQGRLPAQQIERGVRKRLRMAPTGCDCRTCRSSPKVASVTCTSWFSLPQMKSAFPVTPQPIEIRGEALLIAAGQNLKRLLSRRGWGRRPWPSGVPGLVLPPAPALAVAIP